MSSFFFSLNSTASDVSLKTGNAAFNFVVDEGVLSLSSMVNPFTGETIDVTSDDFSIKLKDGTIISKEECQYIGHKKEERQINGKKTQVITVSYRHLSDIEEVRVIYSLGEGDTFIRRRLEMDAASVVMVLDIDVWQLEFDSKLVSQETKAPEFIIHKNNIYGGAKMKGWGMPVLFDSLYSGLEYPAGYNHYEDGELSLSHYPGKNISGLYKSKSCVIGFARKGKAAEDFKNNYLKSVRVTDEKTPFMFIYNTWMTLMPPKKTTVIELASLLEKEFKIKRGYSLDLLNIDDGWDRKKSLWKVETRNFPDKFKDTSKAIRKSGMNMGLWMSPSSSYNHGYWLGKNGYTPNATRAAWICHDKKYTQDMIKQFSRLIKENDIKYMKMDSFGPVCDTDQHHEHLPGIYSKEFQVDGYIKFVSAIRKVQPDIYLNATCGIWLSPWWLMHMDSLWAEVNDGNPPPYHPTIDQKGDVITRDLLVQNRLREHPFIPPNAIFDLGCEKAQHPYGIEDHLVGTVGRGCRTMPIAANLKKLTSKQFDFIASMLNWGKAHSETLMKDVEFIGDIRTGKPYIVRHEGKNESIMVVRNPSINEKTITLPISTASGKGGCRVEVLYPYQMLAAENLKQKSSLKWNLESFQCLLFHVTAEEVSVEAEKVLPVNIAGARYEVTERTENKLVLKVYKDSDSLLTPSVSADNRVSVLKIDGREVSINSTSSTPIRFADAATATAAAFTRKEDKMQGKERTEQLIVKLPKGDTGRLCMLTHHNNRKEKINVKMSIDGKGLKVNKRRAPVISRFQSCAHELPYRPWQYNSCELPSSENGLTVTLQSSLKGKQLINELKNEVYLIVRKPLPYVTVEVELKSPIKVPLGSKRPVPQDSAYEYHLLKLK